MNAGGARQGGDAGDGALGIIGRHHHQVGQLVDDHDDIGHGRQVGVEDAVVVHDVAGAGLAEFFIAGVHFSRHPAQHADGPLQLNDHGRHQMRQAIVAGQLDSFGIDHDELDDIGRIVGDDAVDDGIDADRLAGAGGTSDQQMRHLREITGDRRTVHGDAERDRQRCFNVAIAFGRHHIAQADARRIRIGHLDANIALARDRRFNANRFGAQG